MKSTTSNSARRAGFVSRRRRRRPAALAAVGFVASMLVLVPGTPAGAETVTTCVFNARAAVLTVTVAQDVLSNANAVTFSRTPDDDGGRFQVSATGLAESPTDCGGATVENVDTVMLRSAAVNRFNARTGSLAITIDLANGAFAPGHDPKADVLSPTGEDAEPEIEFDLHFNLGASGSADGVPNTRLDLSILGGPSDDHLAAGWRDCVPEPEPGCRDLNVNLNAGEDGDADVGVTFAEGRTSPSGLIATLHEVTLAGGGGNDVITADGGEGIGGPLPASSTSGTPPPPAGVLNLALSGGSGNDTLVGGSDDDRLVGGAGNDVLDGRAGDDILEGGDGDDILAGGQGNDRVDGGDGDDVLDEGDVVNGTDILDGGDGHDVVDYSQRVPSVTVTRDDVADDGEPGELDNVASDVEDARVRVVDDSAFKDLGTMRSAACILRHKGGGVPERGPCGMFVDEESRLGFSFGRIGDQQGRLWVHDLDRRQVIASKEMNVNLGVASAVVPRLQKIYEAQKGVSIDTETLDVPCFLTAIDYSDLDDIQKVPHRYDGCTRGVAAHSIDYNESKSSLVVSAKYLSEIARESGQIVTPNKFIGENLGASLPVRHLTIRPNGTLRQDWDVDLRYAGCGRRVPSDIGTEWSFAARVGNDLLAYCWDARPGPSGAYPVGEQGYVVRVLLDANGRPIPAFGGELRTDANGAYINYRFVRTPALPGLVVPLVDHKAGVLLLVTEGSVNGNAVWVFNPNADRFEGVISGGATDQPRFNTAAGIDVERGRVYLLTRDGILVAPYRQRPLPAGVVYPIAVNGAGGVAPVEGFANEIVIPVVSSLGRLFLPVNLPGQNSTALNYVVVQDDIAEPPAFVEPDPDADTAQVEERDGVTEVAANAVATGVGTRLLLTGGLPRLVNNVNPACSVSLTTSGTGFTPDRVEVALEPQVFGDGQCAADHVVAPGHREVWLGATSVEAGSGSAAAGAPLLFGTADVTSRDIQARGQCEAGLVGTASRGNLPPEFTDPFGQGCDRFWNMVTGQGETAAPDQFAEHDPRLGVPDPRTGTSGRAGDGFPLRASSCGDFGGVPAEDRDASETADSAVSCDHGATKATAAARGAGLLVSHEGVPLVQVGRSASAITTARTAEGQVTVTMAVAEGVRVGPLTIREVRTVATSRAKGRTGTAAAEIERRWCGLTITQGDTSQGFGDPNADPQPGKDLTYPGCIDPTDPANTAFLTTLNAGLGRLRIGVPTANGASSAEPYGAGEASDGGYQATVVKDPFARGGDQAVNDDDGYTVAGFEAVFYNDGGQGRSRMIVQLAGVHTESRYGIVELPNFGDLDVEDTIEEEVEDTIEEEEAAAVETESDFVPTRPLPEPSASTLPAAEVASDLVDDGEVFETLLVSADSPLDLAGLAVDAQPRDPLRRALRAIPEALRDLWRLFIRHPAEFGLIFGVFSLLATPLYLGLRRRRFAALVA